MNLNKLKSFSTCDISDALIKIGRKDFYIPNLLPFSISSSSTVETDFKFLGYAYTVKVESIREEGTPYHNEKYHWLDQASTENVVIISSPTGAINAVFGGLMGARAKYLGVKGIVVGGRVRDTMELSSFGLNVLAYGKSSLGASGFTHVTGINVPIHFPTTLSDSQTTYVKVLPSDIVVADRDGVVIVPQACFDEVIKICKQIVEVDTRCREDIINGKTISAAFKAHR